MSDLVVPGTVGGSAPGTTNQAWTTSPEADQVIAAFVAALGELSEIPRGEKAVMGTYSYSYASLGAVLAEVRPVLAAHGLALIQPPTIDGHEVVIESTVMHTSGQWIRFKEFRLPAGQTAQQSGSAITYARRYTAMGLLGLATEDDDGQGAGTRPDEELMPEDRVARFIATVTDAGLVVAELVANATGKRTTDPAQVYASEIPRLMNVLNAALKAARLSGGEGRASDTPPDTLPLRDTPDE